MKDAPAFDFYPERWLAGTLHLSPAERGAYINLLCHQWLHGCIPIETPALIRICGCKPADSVLAKFPDGMNPMLELVRNKQRGRIQKSLDKIAKMNAARASCRASTRGTTREPQDDLVERLQDPPHHSPLTYVLLEKEPKRADAPDTDQSSPAKRLSFPLPTSVESSLRELYRRKDSTPWSAKEVRAAKDLRKIPEAQLMADLELFAKARSEGWQFYRRDIFTLLNNWPAEVERCSDFLRTETNGNHPRPTTRQAPVVTRNTAPLPPDLPDLNATAWRPAPRVPHAAGSNP